MTKIIKFMVALAALSNVGHSYKLNVESESFITNAFKNRIDDFEELRNTLSLNAVTPSYFKEFLDLYHKHQNTSVKRLAEQEFLDKIFNGVSGDSCKLHVTEWFTRLSLDNKDIMGEKDAWVLQMIDSWGKLPEGILSGHVSSYGDFDECVGVEVDDLEIRNEIYPELNDKAEKRFVGQYCTAYILDYETAMSVTPEPVGEQLYIKTEIEIQQETLSLHEFLQAVLFQKPGYIMMLPSTSTCMPSSCSVTDVQQLLVNGLDLMYETNAPLVNHTILPWPVTMNCAVKEKPGLDAPAIVVLILLGVLVTLALIAGVLDYMDNHSSDNNLDGGVVYKYLMTFSMYTNTKKLLSTRKSPEDLGCLHGIRFLSTAWVVLAHTYDAFLLGPQWNNFDVKNINKKWTQLAIINGTFSVDTFFLMSGMLATYNILKMLDKTKGKMNLVMFYVHRYIRLTPAYAILVGIGATLTSYAGNGPLWFVVDAQEERCRKNWWTNILYINNLVNAEQMCNGESWYLANDMQFYILSPLIVYPIWRWKKVGLPLLAMYTVLNAISQVLVVRFSGNIPAMVLTNDSEVLKGITEIYMRPWSRISVFLIGIWLGWLLHKTRGKRVNLSKILFTVLWLCSTGIACAVIFGIFPWFNPTTEIPEVPGYFYAGLSRISWGVAVSWIIFACIKGYGGPVNGFLCLPVFMPLGRLCFCVYLVSLHLQIIFHAGLTVPIKLSNYMTVNLYFAHMVMSYLVGFLCTLFFESPFMNLQKLIFETNVKSPGKPGTLKKLSDEETTSSNDVSRDKDLAFTNSSMKV